MKNALILPDLKKRLPEENWPWLFPALHQDPLVWRALEEPDFRGLALSKLENRPEHWSPARLALLALWPDLQLESLRDDPQGELPPELVAQVNAVDPTTANPTNLAEAGLLMLALRARVTSQVDWPELLVGDPQQQLAAGHLTAWAGLFGLLPNPLQILRALAGRTGMEILLRQPLPLPSLNEYFINLLRRRPRAQQTGLLALLAQQRPSAAVEIARQLLKTKSTTEMPADLDAIAGALTELQSQHTLAVEQRICATPEQTAQTLQKNWQLAQKLLVESGKQLAYAASERQEPDLALATWQAAAHFWQPADTAELVNTLFEHQHEEQAFQLAKQLEENPPNHPAVLLALAQLRARRNDLEQARNLSTQALENCGALTSYPLQLQLHCSDLLLATGQPEHAHQVIAALLKNTRNDVRVLILASQAAVAVGKLQAACQFADLAVILQPRQLLAHQVRCQAYSQAARHESVSWQTALSAAQAWLELLPAHDTQAKLEFAHLALQAGEADRASEICEQVLQAEPHNGLALALLGTAQHARNQTDLAESSFEQALQYNPEQGQVWLLRATAQQETGQIEAALESLKKGLNAAPGDVHLLLALGQLYDQQNQHTAALEALQQADALVKEKAYRRDYDLQAHIAAPLAKNLSTLGHSEQALQIARQAYRSAPANLALARVFASLLDSSGDTGSALPLLKMLAQRLPQDLEVRLAYARALLTQTGDPHRALSLLEHILQQEPQHAEALTLYAEAQAGAQQWLAAMASYQAAMRTALALDPDWQRRLGLGLGRVALHANQPEVGVAALEALYANRSTDLEVLQLLATAYAQADLATQADQSAAAALGLQPDSLDNLIWYASFQQQSGNLEACIRVLERAVQMAPEHVAIRIQLAQAQEGAGQVQAARKNYAAIYESEEATIEDLIKTAQTLLDLQAPELALPGLERARYSLADDSQQTDLLVEILDALAKAYYLSGELPAALAALEQGLAIAPNRADLLSAQTTLYLESGNLPAAAESMRATLELAPDQPDYLRQAARLLRSQGKPEEALQHAAHAFAKDPAHLGGRALAAELALALLLPERAQEYLSLPSSQQVNRAQSNALDFFCLQAEQSLKLDEEVAAAEALTAALQIQPQHPRVLALQAQLSTRQRDLEHGQEIFLQALEKLGDIHVKKTSPQTLLALAQAGLLFQNWSSALFVLSEAVKLAPQEPGCQLALARGLVLRAEQQRFCQAALAERHAPGESALANYAYEQFEQALLQAAQQVGSRQAKTEIPLWLARGQAAFRPSSEHAQLLSEQEQTPENQAANLAAWRYAGEAQKATELALELLEAPPKDARLLAQCALSLEQDHKAQALQAAQLALQASIHQDRPDRPVYYALVADLSEQLGAYTQARQAIEAALDIWDDEPAWHVRLAEGLLSAPQQELADPQAAIFHLNHALENHAHDLNLQLQLGQAHLQAQDPAGAIEVLERAARNHPRHAKVWLTMAQAYQAARQDDKARPCAERALHLDATEIEAALLLSDLALKHGELQNSLTFSQQVLAQKPDHPRALLFQARALERLNRPTEALAAFEHALPGNAKTVPLMLEHANLVHKARGDSAGLKTLEHLASRHPQEPRILAALAEALTAANQPQNAILAAQKALNNPVDSLPVDQLVELRLLLGNLLRREGQLDQAAHHLHQALEDDPGATAVAVELGRVYQERREYVRAMQVLQQAIQNAPGDPQPLYQAGLALKEAHDYPGAEYYFRRASKLAPHDINIHRQLAAMVALNLVHNRSAAIPPGLNVT